MEIANVASEDEDVENDLPSLNIDQSNSYQTDEENLPTTSGHANIISVKYTALQLSITKMIQISLLIHPHISHPI